MDFGEDLFVLSNIGEEAFDEVEPGSAGGHGVNVKSGTPRQPRLDLGGFMGSAVVDDQMQIETNWRVPVAASEWNLYKDKVPIYR